MPIPAKPTIEPSLITWMLPVCALIPPRPAMEPVSLLVMVAPTAAFVRVTAIPPSGTPAGMKTIPLLTRSSPAKGIETA